MWWFWLIYYVGALATLRASILHLQARCDRRNTERLRRGSPKGWWDQPEAPLVIIVIWAWPLIALGWISWKLMFPFGVKTRQAKALARAVREKALQDAEAARQVEAELSFHKAEQILRDWSVQHPPLAIDASDLAEPALTYELAATSFNEACDQVWRTRGEKWSIGRLAGVRAARRKIKVT